MGKTAGHNEPPMGFGAYSIPTAMSFVFNGTAANSLALASMGQSFHSVICHELAHIETDECGGPEYASNGAKLLLGQGPNGKLTPESIEHLVTKRTDIHYPKPKALSLTQATEVGTVYSPDELRAIRQTADRFNLNIHMDGARFANAVAALDVHPSEITWKAGVDVLCFGHQERPGSGGGRCVLQSCVGRGLRMALQAGGATGVKDALHFRALVRAA